MSSSVKVNIKKMHKDALIPTRATSGSAGYDLYSCHQEGIKINPGEIVKVKTGVAIEILSENYAAFIYARSGLASKNGITLANSVGVIDSDYRGEIIVPLINLKDSVFMLEPNRRFAQMIIMPVCLPVLNPVDCFSQTSRGEKGFGSTGMSEKGFGSTGMSERGFGSTGMSEKSFGSTGMSERGFGSTGMSEKGFGQKIG